MGCRAYTLLAAFSAFVLGLSVMWRMRLGILDASMRFGMTPDLKPWWHSRTLWVNAIVLALAAAETQLQILQPLLPVDVYRLVAFGLPVANAVLRLITTQGLTPR